MIRGQKKSVTILFPMDLYAKLKKLAKQDNRTLSAYVRQALKGHIRSLNLQDDL